jgi:hypothetical protein
MSEHPTTEKDIASLVQFCSSENRICPQFNAWGRFWRLLKDTARERRTTGYDIAMSVDEDLAQYRTRYEPPRPNILSSWWGTSDTTKMETLRRQVLWASQHNVLDVADAFLRNLADHQWHRAAVPSLYSFYQMCKATQQEDAVRERRQQANNREHKTRQAQAHRDRKAAIDRRYAESLDPGLISAYRATAYAVFAEPEFALRIGERSAPLAKHYERTGCHCAAYITGWNPLGTACSPTENAAAQERLIETVNALGLEYLKGEGRGEIGDWPPEESLLIFGCSRSRAKQLGHRFKQNAVVWIGPDAVPDLIMLMPLNNTAGQ